MLTDREEVALRIWTETTKWLIAQREGADQGDPRDCLKAADAFLTAARETEKAKTPICPHDDGSGKVTWDSGATADGRPFGAWVCSECGRANFTDEREPPSPRWLKADEVDEPGWYWEHHPEDGLTVFRHIQMQLSSFCLYLGPLTPPAPPKTPKESKGEEQGDGPCDT